MVKHRLRWLLVVAALAGAAPAAFAQPAPRDFKRWISDEADWLLTPAERRDAAALGDTGSQVQFVRDFWRRRDPTPGTPENELREEHARRLAEADAKFSSGKRGRFTDRGRIYISWGPPDFIETNPSGGRGFALGPLSEAPELPTEAWTYEHLPGLRGRSGRIQVVFVDRGGGDYRLLTDPSDANQAYAYRLNTPANPLQYESAAFLDPATGLKRTDRVAETARAGALGPDTSLSAAANTFERIALGADLSRTAGEVLEDIERSERLRRPWTDVRARMFARRFSVAIDIPVFVGREGNAYTPIAVHIPGDAVTFTHDSAYRAELDVRATIRDGLSGAPVGQLADTLRFHLDERTWSHGRRAGFTYHKALMLGPGEYLIEVSVAQPAASSFGSVSTRIEVPAASNALAIRAMVLGEAAAAGAEAGPFTVGGIDVRPRVTGSFEPGERIHALVQVTGLASAGGDITADYLVMRQDAIVFRSPLHLLPSASAGDGERLLVMPVDPGALPPGAYVLQLKVIEHGSQKYAVARRAFTIGPLPAGAGGR